MKHWHNCVGNAVVMRISKSCDAHTKFHVFDISWPGRTNDIVAYSMTDIYRKATSRNYFPEWATFVLDEAYSSIGGMHLTPFTLSQLRYARRTTFEEYLKMVAFNNVLSSQRITRDHLVF